jgi:uncharacterized membrane protein YadS
LNSGFLYLWKNIPPKLPQKYSSKVRLFGMMIPLTLSIWSLFALGLSFSLSALQDQGIPVMWIGFAAFFLQFLLGVIGIWLQPAPGWTHHACMELD